MKIIYKNESGGVSVVHPTEEALQVMTMKQIADLSVPEGVRYTIVEDDVLPTDRTFRDAWVVDEDLLTDGVGAA